MTDVERLLRESLADWPEGAPAHGFREKVERGVSRRRRQRTVLCSAAAAIVLAAGTVGGVLAATGPSGAARVTPVGRHHSHGQGTAPGGSVAIPIRRTGPGPRLPAASYAAVVHRGVLRVVDVSTGVATVVARGSYRYYTSSLSSPEFSQDGHWLAWLDQSGGTSVLHVVSLVGGRGWTASGVGTLAWSPNSDVLALLTQKAVEMVTAAGQSLAAWRAHDPDGEVFADIGNRVAVGGHYLRVYRAAGGRPNTVANLPGGCLLPAAFTLRGRRVLAWQDGGCSASIAADGLPLTAYLMGGGRALRLTDTLPYPGWVLPQSGPRVLVDAGVLRVAAHHKRLETCDAATGTCRRLPLPAGMSALDPAFDNGRLLSVREPSSGDYSEFAPPGRLWLSTVSGVGARRLKVGTDVHDPTASPDGDTVLFLRVTRGGSTLQRYTPATGQVRELAAIDQSAVYYGEVVGGIAVHWAG